MNHKKWDNKTQQQGQGQKLQDLNFIFLTRVERRVVDLDIFGQKNKFYTQR